MLMFMTNCYVWYLFNFLWSFIVCWHACDRISLVYVFLALPILYYEEIYKYAQMEVLHRILLITL